jgi:hypothetical protein
MSDVLIRDIPEEVLAAIDAHAMRLAVSRSEYIRRRLAQDAAAPVVAVSVDDLRSFAEDFVDLSDATVMVQAWQ